MATDDDRFALQPSPKNLHNIMNIGINVRNIELAIVTETDRCAYT